MTVKPVGMRTRSLRRALGLDQPLRTCPRQNVIGRTGSRACRPAALFHEIALLPARGYFFQRGQVGNGLDVLLEFIHADRSEDRHDRRVGPLVRKLVRGAGRHPTAPGEADDRDQDRSAGRAPEGRFGLGGKFHGVFLFDERMCAASGTRAPNAGADRTGAERSSIGSLVCLPTASALPAEESADFGRSALYGQLSDKPLLAYDRIMDAPS